MDLLVRAAN